MQVPYKTNGELVCIHIWMRMCFYDSCQKSHHEDHGHQLQEN